MAGPDSVPTARVSPMEIYTVRANSLHQGQDQVTFDQGFTGFKAFLCRLWQRHNCFIIIPTLQIREVRPRPAQGHKVTGGRRAVAALCALWGAGVPPGGMARCPL